MDTLTPQAIEEHMSELVEACRQDLHDSAGKGGPVPTSIRTLDAVWAEAGLAGRGGKRLRALLLWDSYRAASTREGKTDQTDQATFDLACALEVYQTSALVHDDIIDNSPLRRGRPSAHRVLSNLTDPGSKPDQATSAERPAPGTATPRGQGLGILLGDLLATASTDMASKAASALPSCGEILKTFLDMQTAVEIGQVLDMGMEVMPLDHPDQLEREALRTMGWKTASYTAMAPLALGLMAGGIDPDQSRKLSYDLGLDLGLLFQLRDDLMDVVGRSDQTGKPQGGDILEGKRTVLLADTLSLVDPADAARLRETYAAPHRTPDQVDWTRHLMETSGAVKKSRRRLDRLSQSVQAGISTLRQELSMNEEQGSIIEEACRRFMPDAPAPGYHGHGFDEQ